jgi:cobalt-zinc-cadmium efflux system protein
MHDHHGHGHGHGAGGATGAGLDEQRRRSRRRLVIALVLAASYMGAEIVGGLLTGSLALLADAGHMAADVGALLLALFANWVASRPSDVRWTYGRARAEVLAALAQGAGLVAVAFLVVREAIERLDDPTPVLGVGMLAIATGGLVVNLAAMVILHGGRDESMSVRGAWLHVLSDALGSVGAMTAGALVWAFGWYWADPAVSVLICALILFSAWHLLRDAVDVLMEAAPRHLDVDEIRRSLSELAMVREVHDLHVWTIGSGEISLSCHLVSGAPATHTDLLRESYELLGERFAIAHATIQIEPESFAGQTPASVCSGGCNETAEPVASSRGGLGAGIAAPGAG